MGWSKVGSESVSSCCRAIRDRLGPISGLLELVAFFEALDSQGPQSKDFCAQQLELEGAGSYLPGPSKYLYNIIPSPESMNTRTP